MQGKSEKALSVGVVYPGPKSPNLLLFAMEMSQPLIREEEYENKSKYIT